jgi:hypothetical protein
MLAGQTVAVVSDSPVNYSSSDNRKATDEDDEKSDSESERTIEELNWERSRLPSAGHGVPDEV